MNVSYSQTIHSEQDPLVLEPSEFNVSKRYNVVEAASEVELMVPAEILPGSPHAKPGFASTWKLSPIKAKTYFYQRNSMAECRKFREAG
ncbi:hypothetical protein FQN57_006091 [Myotisia sp. PD_48]|nr:hypothetical protein FQN57_006091 [Myotisia sp. PD_48]